MNQAAASIAGPRPFTLNRWLLLWAAMIAIVIVMMLARDWWPWAFKYPRAWQLPLAGWISDFMKWLVNSFDLGLFTFKDFTRGLAWLVEQPYILVKSLLSTGFLKGVGSDAEQGFPRSSWLVLRAGVRKLVVVGG